MLCTIPTQTGRVTLEGFNFKIRKIDVTTERTIADWTECQQILKDYFKIEIPHLANSNLAIRFAK
jgi:arylamine N-acetyltransferase